MIRIGISADLSPNGSIHQDTFIRAVKLAEKDLKLKEKGFELIWENDFANAQGGTIAAKKNLDHKVHAVVGHYASAAAKNALKVYDNKIPVFLPAATADELTEDYDCSYRLCGRDDDLAEFIAEEFANKLPHSLYIEHDQSTHGFALSDLIKKKITRLAHIDFTHDLSKAKKVIFVGNYSSSIAFCENNIVLLEGIDEICFTDDLVRPELPENLNFIGQSVHVFGYEHALQCSSAQVLNSKYYQEWGTYPLTYFLETYAALQIIDQLFMIDQDPENWMPLLKPNVWETCLGNISFDLKGDSNSKRFAKWSIDNTQLVVVETYN